MEEIIITPGCICINDDYDRATLFPGWEWGDGSILFRLQNNRVVQMFTGDEDTNDWHPIDLTKVNYLLLEFILQYSNPNKYPYTKEVLDYTLKEGYISQRFYDRQISNSIKREVV